jgi:hypothetical protein
MKRGGIPESLAEVAEETRKGEPFHLAFHDFLDGFYREPVAEALREEPAFLEPIFGREGAIQDAYLAAAAEKLAREYRLPVPDWTPNPRRALREPWFASKAASLRALLIHESPPEFRCRNLFVSENALTRV